MAIALGTNSFSPTFIRGAPGQRLTLRVTNPSALPHTLTLAAQSIDQAIPANGQAEVMLTFPESGVARFFCRLHEGSGMNGQLLAGNAQPQAVSERPAAPGSDYGY